MKCQAWVFSVLFFAWVASTFRSGFLVLITPANPRDSPLSGHTVDVSSRWAGTTSGHTHW